MRTRLFAGAAASAAMVLALNAGAAVVATATYTNVNQNGTAPFESRTLNVTATDAVDRVLISGTLNSIAPGTWGQDVTLFIFTPDFQVLAIDPFGQFGFTTLTLANLSTEFGAQVANAAGDWTIEFTETFDDAQGASADANWSTITFSLENGAPPPPPPPPACPVGTGNSLTFTNVSSNGPVGFAGNSIVTGNFNAPGLINQIGISGRLTAFGASWRSDAAFAITAPDGSQYFGAGLFGLPASAGTSDIAPIFLGVPGTEDGTGTWTIEFYETFNDAQDPDTTWETVCFALNSIATSPTATDIATPANAPRDGVTSVTLAVTVVRGLLPTSTFANVGSGVVVDDLSVGGSGALVLLDDGIGADLLANDSIYTGTTTVATSTILGFATLPYTVTDDQGRNGGAGLALNFTVVEAVGACCLSDGSCIVTDINNCVTTLGGTFAGAGTSCGAPTALSTDGAGAFENISGTGTVLAAASGDDTTGNVAIPFSFNYFGVNYTDVNVSTNGNIQFPASASNAWINGPIPSAAIPNNALYVLWDDLNVTSGGQVFTQQLGTIGTDARFIIQWNIVRQFGGTDSSTFQIALFEDGNFEFRYLSVSAESVVGDTTTIGFEDGTGIVASTLAETRASLSTLAPISYRANSTVSDTGVCSACPACPADYNQDGGVTGDDIAAFFADFEAGGGCADTNVDGGITGDDIAAFFTAFEAGGC